MKRIFITLSTIAFVIFIYLIINSKININPKLNIGDCISADSNNVTIVNKELRISYIEKASSRCLNPNFPAIHIFTTNKHNAWLQIVFTDSTDPKLQEFIDSSSDNYPFYSFEQDYYDAPLWEYSIISKPLSFWKAHTYAIKLDRKNQIIEFVKGVEWGFTFTKFALHPKFTKPRILKQSDWQQDLQIFNREFSKYKIK